MSDALLISNLALWVAVVLLAGVVLALVRQLGVLHERVAPAGALMLGAGPRVGEAPAPLEVEELSGATRRVGGPHPEGRATLLFFLSPTCPVCTTLLPALRSVTRREGAALEVVLASDGPEDEHRAFVSDLDLERYPYVVSTELGLAYRVARLPFAVLLDADGTVVAQGLVNTREHLESLFAARDAGVASLQELLARRAEEASDGRDRGAA